MVQLPQSLAPFFQEYDWKKLDPERDRVVIIERVLRFGSSEELKWLFKTFGVESIRRFLRDHGFRRLSERDFNYWCLILGVKGYRKPEWLQGGPRFWMH